MPRAQVANIGVFEFSGGTSVFGVSATGTATLTDVVDTDTFTLDDGVNTAVTYEFESVGGVTPGNVEVTIGVDDDADAANLAAAIEASYAAGDLLFRAVAALNVVTITAVTDEGSETDGNAYTMAQTGDTIELNGAAVASDTLAGGIDATNLSNALVFRVKEDVGGTLELLFENTIGDEDLTVSVEVASSPTGTTTPHSATGYAAGIVTQATVVRRGTRAYTQLMRRGQDLYLRVRSAGRARGMLQIRGDQILEPVTI